MRKKSWFVGIMTVVIACGSISCNKINDTKTAQPALVSPQENTLTKNDVFAQSLHVYKSPTCSCCTRWVDHMRDAGFTATVHDVDDLDAIKQNHNLAEAFRSCHTAVTDDGYVFEGHVPAGLVKRFLTERPADARGLVVPAMPVGSPGMEMGETFMPYDVLLLKKNGGTEVYARVSSREQQYQ